MITYTVCIYLFHCKTFGLQHCYYNTILAFQKVSRSMVFHSRLNSWYQHQMLINESQQHVNHSLSSSFHVITCGMQLFLPEQTFDISRMKSHSTGSYNMQH